MGVVEKITQLDTLGEVSCPPQLIKQYKRRKGGSIKGGNSHNQKLSSAFQHVGKLGRFLAPMKLGLIPIKVDRKFGGKRQTRVDQLLRYCRLDKLRMLRTGKR